VIHLREFTRVDADLQEDARRLANQLRAQLHRFYVQPLALCPGADEPWLWALLQLAPTPAAAARLREARLATLLRAHHIRRVTAGLPKLQRRRSRGARRCRGDEQPVTLLLPRLQLPGSAAPMWAADRGACCSS
jgi:hypothetical protein